MSLTTHRATPSACHIYDHYIYIYIYTCVCVCADRYKDRDVHMCVYINR